MDERTDRPTEKATWGVEKASCGVGNLECHFRKSGEVGPFMGWLEPLDKIHTQGTFEISLSNGVNQNVLGQIVFKL